MKEKKIGTRTKNEKWCGCRCICTTFFVHFLAQRQPSKATPKFGRGGCRRTGGGRSATRCGAIRVARPAVLFQKLVCVDAAGTKGHVRGVDIFKIKDGLISEKLSYVKG